MIREFENDCDKHRRAKEQIIITLVLITATVIGMIFWVPQSFAATYIPPNSSSSTNGVLSIPNMNTPASSVQCLPGYSPDYSGYIAGLKQH